jgi:hypothetical protein
MWLVLEYGVRMDSNVRCTVGCGWYERCGLWMAGKVLDVAGIRVWSEDVQ